MSYILEALRKAERERDATRVPTVMTVHEFRTMRRNRLLAVAGGIALFGAAGWFFWGPRIAIVARTAPGRSAASPDSVVVKAEARGADAAPALATPTVPSAPPAATPAPQPPEPFVRSVPTPSPEASPQRAAALPAPQPAALSGASAQGGSHTFSARPATAAAQQPGFTAANVPSSPAAPAALPAPSLQAALAGMSVSLLMYAEAEAERIVFINGRKYAKGDLVDGLYLVESITPEGVVLTHQRERVILRPPARN